MIVVIFAVVIDMRITVRDIYRKQWAAGRPQLPAQRQAEQPTSVDHLSD